MIVSIASGKGGTGKTTIAVNLACSIGQPVQLLDCDVEEPNCHIFLKPEIHKEVAVTIPVPTANDDLCTACGQCSSICQYHAIISLNTTPLVFPELCHGCGGCTKVCPSGALSEVARQVGVMEYGNCGLVEFIQGRLDIGQSMSPPVIRAVKHGAHKNGITIIDCPPGTSCPVIAAVRGSDYVVLVTEPTPFGLHDLSLAVDTMRQLGLNYGVVINRADVGDNRVDEFCHNERIPVLLRIADDRKIAEAYSRGEIAVDLFSELKKEFEHLFAVIAEISHSSHCSSLANEA